MSLVHLLIKTLQELTRKKDLVIGKVSHFDYVYRIQKRNVWQIFWWNQSHRILTHNSQFSAKLHINLLQGQKIKVILSTPMQFLSILFILKYRCTFTNILRTHELVCWTYSHNLINWKEHHQLFWTANLSCFQKNKLPFWHTQYFQGTFLTFWRNQPVQLKLRDDKDFWL